MDASSYSLIVAIDFGTARTGYGFAWTSEPSKVIPNRPWPHCPGSYIKTLTQLLLNEDLSFNAFGFEARNKVLSLASEDELLWFSRYKMGLHKADGEDRSELIPAINKPSVKIPLSKLVVTTLKFIKDSVLQEINLITTTELDRKQIRWVLTVPAIWDAAAKQFMIESAMSAGLSDSPENIIIALEPEAASLYCMNQHSIRLEPNTKYIVIDAGGGTMDITCHQTIGAEGGVREIEPPSGGDWGSTYVNENFIAFLETLLGKETINQAKREPDWIQVLDSFEDIKLSTTLDEPDTSMKSISIGWIVSGSEINIDESIKQWNAKNPSHKLVFSRGMLRMSPGVVQGFFIPLIQKTIDHVCGLLNKESLKDTKYIFLVGGFAESPFLQTCIFKEFQEKRKLKVVIPSRPSLAVISGAVQYGFQPSSIVCRVAPCTFGIEISEPWDDRRHSGASKVTYGPMSYAENVFDAYIRKGEWVDNDSEVRRTYTPIDPSQDQVNLYVFSCDKPNPFYVTDPGVHYIGTLTLNIPDVGKPNSERQVEAIMKFGGTAFSIHAVHKKSGKKVNAEFKFLLTGTDEALNYVKKKKTLPKTSIDLCFLMDCTGSMGSWIKAAKEKVIAISEAVLDQNRGAELRIGFVGYRDYGYPDRFEVTEFTSNIQDLKNSIHGIVADGGDDTPEDVLGGLDQVISMNWKATSKVMIHIADAPCHGREYNDAHDDRYPEADPSGMEISDLVKDVAKMGIDYYFIKINDYTDKMINLFRTYYDTPQKKIQVHELRADTSKLLPTVVKCVITSVTAYK